MRQGAILRSFENRPIGELYLGMLMDAGLPVRLEIPLTGSSAINPGACDLYINDEKLLEDPEVKSMIDAVFAPIDEPNETE